MTDDPTFQVTPLGTCSPTLDDLKAYGLPENYTPDQLKAAVRAWWLQTEIPDRLLINVSREVVLQGQSVAHKVSDILVVAL